VKLKGVNYDVGIYPLGKDQPSRPVFDPAIVRREIEIIQQHLHCNAIRIVGHDLERLVPAADHVLSLGLEVWFSPALHDAKPAETLAYFARCAQAAEQLRRQHGRIVFVAGWELTFFMAGLVSGATGPQRMQVFMQPWRLLVNTVVKGPFNWRLNRFLRQANAVVRRHSVVRSPMPQAHGRASTGKFSTACRSTITATPRTGRRFALTCASTSDTASRS
jgi:hypothetical protein